MRLAFIASILLWIVIGFGLYYSWPNSNIYACSEVTKQDPEDVQKICKRAWRRYD